MRNVIILVTVVIIIAMVIKLYRKKASRKERATVIVDKGIKTSGSVVGIKEKNGFDHDRNTKGNRIDLKIKYINPHTNVEHIIDYFAWPGTPGLHPYILSASGYIDTGSIGSAFKAVRNHRKELMSQGLTGQELKKAVEEYALKISENPSRTTDETGYVVFDKNIPVDVYVLPDDATDESKIHVKFLYDPKNNSDLFTVD